MGRRDWIYFWVYRIDFIYMLDDGEWMLKKWSRQEFCLFDRSSEWTLFLASLTVCGSSAWGVWSGCVINVKKIFDFWLDPEKVGGAPQMDKLGRWFLLLWKQMNCRIISTGWKHPSICRSFLLSACFLRKDLALKLYQHLSNVEFELFE